MAAAATLVLRDVHQPPAPPWWPPAPGWWLLAALAIAMIVLLWAWRHRRLQRRRRVEALFDAAVAEAVGAPAQVAAMSELLRRAARRRDAGADRLAGDAWLAFLDAGDAAKPFSAGAGRLLLDGGFRPALDQAAIAPLHQLARTRFLDWMQR